MGVTLSNSFPETDDSYISQGETLYPARFFGTGTFSHGSGLETDSYLKRKETLSELEFDKIGISSKSNRRPQNLYFDQLRIRAFSALRPRSK